MKLILCAIIVSVVVGAHALTDAQKEKLRAHGEACITETGVSRETIEKVRQGEQVDDPKLKSHALCMLKKSGMITENGELSVDTIRTKLKEANFNDEQVEELITKCAVKKDTPEDTAYNTLGCLMKNRNKN